MTAAVPSATWASDYQSRLLCQRGAKGTETNSISASKLTFHTTIDARDNYYLIVIRPCCTGGGGP